MTNIQLVKTDFPDTSFFGNFFVAHALAKNPQKNLSTLIAAHPPKYNTSNASEMWKRQSQEQGFTLEFANYMAGVDDDRTGNSLKKILDKTLKETNTKPVVDFHYPERSMLRRQGVQKEIHDTYKDDITQVAHLHCMRDIIAPDINTIPEGKSTAWLRKRTERLLEFYEKGIIKKYITVSPEVKESFLPILPAESMSVVSNGINEETYHFRKEEDKESFRRQFSKNKHIDPQRLTIGYSGRLEDCKGYETLTDVIQWFDKNKEYNTEFLIATSGGNRFNQFYNDLTKKAPRMLEEDRVGIVLDVAKLVGKTKHFDAQVETFFQEHVRNLQQEYQQKKGSLENTNAKLYRGTSLSTLQSMSDVYIQPSNTEAFGLATLEAIFTGTPVVATRTGGLKTLVSAQVGALTDPDQKKELFIEEFAQNIIEQFNKNYGQTGDKNTAEFRQEARNRLLPKYSEKRMKQETEDLYAQARTL